jgi:hypothetical protein
MLSNDSFYSSISIVLTIIIQMLVDLNTKILVPRERCLQTLQRVVFFEHERQGPVAPSTNIYFVNNVEVFPNELSQGLMIGEAISVPLEFNAAQTASFEVFCGLKDFASRNEVP